MTKREFFKERKRVRKAIRKERRNLNKHDLGSKHYYHCCNILNNIYTFYRKGEPSKKSLLEFIKVESARATQSEINKAFNRVIQVVINNYYN